MRSVKMMIGGAVLVGMMTAGAWMMGTGEDHTKQSMKAGDAMGESASKDMTMKLFAKCVGEWRTEATWSNGNPLKAREVHTLGLNGTVMKSQTFVTKEDGSEYQRYEMVTWWDEAEKRSRYMEWVFDGTTEEGEVVASDEATLTYPPRVDKDGKMSPIRQWITFVGNDEYDWTVKMKQEDGGEETLIEGKWMKKK